MTPDRDFGAVIERLGGREVATFVWVGFRRFFYGLRHGKRERNGWLSYQGVTAYDGGGMHVAGACACVPDQGWEEALGTGCAQVCQYRASFVGKQYNVGVFIFSNYFFFCRKSMTSRTMRASL